MVFGTSFAQELPACEKNDAVSTSLAAQSEARAMLVNEVTDHRYEDCSDGTECFAHINELAQNVNAIDDALEASCPGYSKWITGLDGLADPRSIKDGTLTQYAGDDARHALHDVLVALAVAGSDPGQDTLEAILTMGAPGSGKSSALNQLGLCQADVVLIDPDEFKKHLVEYQAAIAADDTLAADRVHRESSMLAKRARDEAIATRRDICIDGVLSKRDAAIELIDRLHAAGYTITLVAADVPFDVAYERVIARGEQTGRFVPYDYAKQAHANIEKHRDDLMRLVDNGYIFDTSKPYGVPPTLVAQYRDGEKIKGDEE